MDESGKAPAATYRELLVLLLGGAAAVACGWLGMWVASPHIPIGPPGASGGGEFVVVAMFASGLLALGGCSAVAIAGAAVLVKLLARLCAALLSKRVDACRRAR